MDPFMNPELRKAYGAAAKKAINSKVQWKLNNLFAAGLVCLNILNQIKQ